MADVKRPSRAERARQTRTRMIGTARELFLAQGWAATTMEQIAQGSGVAVQTVYYTFKTKGHLLAELVNVTAAGNDVPDLPIQRPWAQEMLSSALAPAGPGPGSGTWHGHLRKGRPPVALDQLRHG